MHKSHHRERRRSIRRWHDCAKNKQPEPFVRAARSLRTRWDFV